jgi:hypothetical protein
MRLQLEEFPSLVQTRSAPRTTLVDTKDLNGTQCDGYISSSKSACDVFSRAGEDVHETTVIEASGGIALEIANGPFARIGVECVAPGFETFHEFCLSDGRGVFAREDFLEEVVCPLLVGV